MKAVDCRSTSRGLGTWLLIGAALAVMVPCHAVQAAPPEEQPAVAVTAVKPQRKALRRNFELAGQVEASQQADLFARVTGYVRKVQVDLGDRVKAGEVLAELSVPELQAEHKEKAALAALTEAELEQVRGAVKAAEVALVLATAQVQEAEAGTKRARATLDLRKAEYDRVAALERTKVVDSQVVAEKRSQLEGARSAVEEAEAKVKAAQAAREGSAVKRETAQAEVKTAQARIDVARAGLLRAQTVLEYAQLIAPFDGIVTRRKADPGSLAGPPTAGKAEPLFVVTKIDPVRIAVALPERDLFLVGAGMPVTIHFDSLKGQDFAGKITRTAGVLHPTTRTLHVEIDLPNPNGKLLPGMSATVTIPVEQADVWTVPAKAVVSRGGPTFCYRVEGGRAIRTPVAVGLEAEGRVALLKKQTKPGAWEDLIGDEEIVVSDPAKLTDGQAVRVVPAEKPKDEGPRKPPARDGSGAGPMEND